MHKHSSRVRSAGCMVRTTRRTPSTLGLFRGCLRACWSQAHTGTCSRGMAFADSAEWIPEMHDWLVASQQLGPVLHHQTAPGAHTQTLTNLRPYRPASNTDGNQLQSCKVLPATLQACPRSQCVQSYAATHAAPVLDRDAYPAETGPPVGLQAELQSA